MRLKLIALALAVTVAIGTGGIVAANSAGSDVADTHSTTTGTATVEAGGYDFALSDQDDWFTGDRADARETVAELVVTDDEAGERLRTLFDDDEQLSMDVYGNLQSEDDSAHVRVYPDRASTTGDPRPLLEATVDLSAGTVDLVGVSTEPIEAGAVRSADESTTIDLNDSAVPVSPGGRFEVDPDGNDTTLAVDAVTDIDVPPANVTRNGSVVRIDLPVDTETVTVGDDIEIVDETGDLTDTTLERVRGLVANDSDARAALADRFGADTTVVLTVEGVGPSGDVQMDATAPGDNPETVVVVDRSDARVSIESVHLLTAEQSSTVDYDARDVRVEQAP